MKKLFLLLLSITSLLPMTAYASVVECANAYIDTIAIEADRPDKASLSKTLLISFKDANGNLLTCGMGTGRYAYLEATKHPEVFNAMMSIAFMAKANNLPVRYFILSDRQKFSARELSVIQLQSSISGFYELK
ncbi:hypothetical protein [Pseudoalteromonas aurantia]|uniref:Uncharacterized protein n=1 Tax=Pseudoalteromonas aurantia 208 TaxID=1314867 RepID=A0ABR9EC47_9GAMM|nr:hypothetical protein [Pseudoalteromonas aurantia]MBE0368571.1 hypothetical protein [Pseudoalteromonas aurantia 208]